MENIGEKRMDMISKWEEKSRDFIDAFLLLFGREGRLVSNMKNFDFNINNILQIIIKRIINILLLLLYIN